MDENVDIDQVIEDLEYEAHRNQFLWWSWDFKDSTARHLLMMSLEWSFQRNNKTNRPLFTTNERRLGKLESFSKKGDEYEPSNK